MKLTLVSSNLNILHPTYGIVNSMLCKNHKYFLHSIDTHKDPTVINIIQSSLQSHITTPRGPQYYIIILIRMQNFWNAVCM